LRVACWMRRLAMRTDTIQKVLPAAVYTAASIAVVLCLRALAEFAPEITP